MQQYSRFKNHFVLEEEAFLLRFFEVMIYFPFTMFVEQNSVLPDGVLIGKVLLNCMNKLVGKSFYLVWFSLLLFSGLLMVN